MTTETREDETDGYRARVDVVYARLSGGGREGGRR